MENFSVCMSVYRNDKPTDFVIALESIYQSQTVKPSEIVLIVDGPVGKELGDVIEMLASQIPVLKVIRFPENRGHAVARQEGLEQASYELVAVMDADDISVADRFEKQLRFMEEHSDIVVCGGQIMEFVGTEDNVVGERIVPCNDNEIKVYLKSRCPMNLVTVMLRKSATLSVGGYQDWYCEEDYYLWIRMMLADCKFANLPDTLVKVRVGKDMYARRGGWRYFKSEAGIQKLMWKNGIISWPRLFFNVFARLVVQVLMPNWLRGFVFQKLFRK